MLDLTRILAGPVATRLLAGWGADVLRIDPPGWDEPGLVPEVTLGKRCAHLDLRTPDGRDHLLGLLDRADVLVHGYRPGALEGLGLGTGVRDATRPASSTSASTPTGGPAPGSDAGGSTAWSR